MSNITITLAGNDLIDDLRNLLDDLSDKGEISEDTYELTFADNDPTHFSTVETADLVLKSAAILVPILIHFLNRRDKKNEKERIKIDHETADKNGGKIKVTREFESEEELKKYLESIQQ